MKSELKARKLILILSVMAAAMAFGMGAAVAATNEVSALLQKGLFEEEANRNLDAAIKAYQSVITQTDKDRQFAATAIFRLGECYRKQGQTNEANVQYQRILREFPEQTELAKLSREQLGPAAVAVSGGGDSRALADELRKMSPEKRRVAVQQKFPNPVLNSLMEKMTTTEQELISLKSTYGDKHPEVVAKAALLAQVQKQVDDQVDGVLDGLSAQQQANASGTGPHQQTAEDLNRNMDEFNKRQEAEKEQDEIKRIQATIKDNPDLINAYNGENTPLLSAVRNQQAAVVKFLLENHADTELKQNGRGYHSPPLVLAAMLESKDIVEQLLEHGANVNDTDDNHTTALYWAAERGYKTIAEPLLANKAEVDARDKDGRTALRVAAEKGFRSVAELLAAHGADVNSRDNNGVTPLQSAASAGNKAIVEWLLANKATVNVADKDGWTPLAAAIRFGRLEIAKMLLAHAADIENKAGQRPLFVAVQNNWPDGVKLLLEHHANVNAFPGGAEDRGNNMYQGVAMTPLTMAANSKFDEVARLLIDADANVNLPASSGRTPLMFAIERNDDGLIKLLLDHHADPNFADNRFNTPLFYAVEMDRAAAVAALLDHGAKVNASRPENAEYSRMTALQMAVGQNNTNMVKMLLEHGADPNTTVDTIFAYNGQYNFPGSTPLLTAVRNNSPGAVRLLLDHRADPSRGDSEGRTPLHLAVGPSSAEIAEMLVAAKADVNARNKNGQTPLHLAAERNFGEMVDFLIAHGADVNAKDNNGKTPLDAAGTQAGNLGRPGMQPGPPIGLRPGGPQPAFSVAANGSAPLSYQWRTGSDETQPSGARDAAAILREHGGVSEVELSTIRLTRKGLNPVTVLRSTEAFENQPTLYEVISAIYKAPARFSIFAPNRLQSLEGNEPPGPRFPDFDHLKIVRHQSDGRTEPVSVPGLAAALADGDCSADVPLRWGDMLEIPEADHKIDARWTGLPEKAVGTLDKCLTRKVDVMVKGQVTHLLLSPQIPIYDVQVGGGSTFMFHFQPHKDENGEKQILGFRLNDVVRKADVILASSDLTRVKVRRKDPATGKTSEVVFNLEKTDPETDLWLHDGDAIEIPEKSGE